jgi:hypothetical protein
MLGPLIGMCVNRTAATSSIDRRSGPSQGSFQAFEVVARIAAVHVRRVTLIWRALPRTPIGAGEAQEGNALLVVAVPS